MQFANTGHSFGGEALCQMDPERPFAVGPMTGRCAPDSGRRPNATVALTTDILVLITER